MASAPSQSQSGGLSGSATVRSALPRPPPRKDVPSRLPAPDKSNLSTTPASSSHVTADAQPPAVSKLAQPARRLVSVAKPVTRKPVPARTTSARVAATALHTTTSTSNPSDSRHAADRAAPSTTPTPSLVSGSSVSTQENPRAHMLRRKPSTIALFKADKYPPKKLSGVNAQQVAPPLDLGTPHKHEPSSLIALQPSSPAIQDHARHELPFLPSLRTDDSVAHGQHTDDMRPAPRPTPVSEVSATPSLPHTESPGAFSQFTAATSVTSYSPAISASSRTGASTTSFGFSPEKSRSSASTPYRSGKPAPAKSSTGAHPFFSQTESLSDSRPSTRDGSEVPVRASSLRHKGQQSPQRGSSEKPLPVHPPELAHLNADASSADSASGSLPRPSRDIIRELSVSGRDAHTTPTTELPRLTTSFSTLKPTLETSPARAGRPADLLSPFNESSSDTTAKPTSNSETALSPSPASASTEKLSSKPKSRFGFFKRSKSDNQDTLAGQKFNRKGPVAGTGHEGYGKQPAKTRTGSSSSQTSSGSLRFGLYKRKSSSGSSKAPDLDDFLQKRLSPVYIRGDGSATGSQPRGSGSIVDESPFSSDISSPDTPETSVSAHEPSKPSIGARIRQSFEGSRGRNAHDEHPAVEDQRPAPASRSTSHKRMTKPKSTGNTKLKGLGSSSETNLAQSLVPVARPATSAGVVSAGRKATSNEHKPAGKAGWSLFNKSSVGDKQASTSWNPFSRSKTQLSEDPVANSESVPAHYISSDEDDQIDADDLDTIMREAVAAHADNRLSVMTDFEDDGDSLEEPNRRLPAPATASQISIVQSIDEALSEEASHQQQIEAQITELVRSPSDDADLAARPCRLSSVGRIPKVVSKRDRVRKLPDLSFSRPFLNAQPRPAMQQSSLSLSSKLTAFPPSVRSLSPTKGNAAQGSTTSLDSSQPGLSRTRSDDLTSGRQFLDFGKRKNSETSFSSSAGTMHFPTAGTIAHGPGRNSHVSTDETWPEFDDLIDRVITPTDESSSPRRISKALSELNEETLGSMTAKPQQSYPKIQSIDQFPKPPASTGYSPTNDVSSSLDKVGSAVSSASYREASKPPRTSSVYSQRDEVASLKSKRSASLPDDLEEDPVNHAIAEKEKAATQEVSTGQENMALFRFRVLMTSKWLSFGRLLFSPVYKELEKKNPDDRVLIVDGLGNRDWSYYCAVTYPNTQIYSLSPIASSSSNGRSSLGGFGQLPNHRNFTYTNFGTDFPFPKSFFAAVILRFPAATTEAIQKLTISECKRVLRPGGFIEISTVDLDLTNMGNLARRAVRDLKIRMAEANPEVLLKPASDHVQNLLHRRGFENLNRCFVAVPAAGAIPSADEKPDLDFSELAKDHSSEGDKHITKLVAQVGRWWYNRCYESVAADDASTMWTDPALLAECEQMSTAFKLLICYAQKPTCAKRRTVSL